ncbi:MAG TPA: hypothetical protein VK048_01165, partial [Atopostipes sp.]|nr:hypothetical protein [Atopostipes sp.]
NQNMWRFRALDKKISPFYINYIVKKINEEVSGWTSGSAREFYRKDVFGKQKIAVPSLVVMERFNKLTQTLFAQIDILKQENNLLAKTRDTLLPKLMSGEIRVEEAIEVE